MKFLFLHSTGEKSFAPSHFNLPSYADHVKVTTRVLQHIADTILRPLYNAVDVHSEMVYCCGAYFSQKQLRTFTRVPPPHASSRL